MSPETFNELILQYGYWMLIPLSLIEGPLIAFVAGTLASLGFFNMYALGALFFIRDVGMDAVYYAIGHYGAKTAFVQRMMKKLGITADHLDQVRVLWEKRPGWTMFIGKVSYGIAHAFIVVAGTVRMPLPLFFKWASIIAVVQYGTLLLLGYFLGTSFGGTVEKVILNVQYVVAVATVAITAYYIVSWRARQRLLAEDKKIEEMPPDTEVKV